VRRCAFCQVEIPEERRDIYRETMGWARPGKGVGGKSGSSLVLRRDTGAVAHATCIERAKLGLHPHQSSLLDTSEEGTLWSGSES
jgi:hypothetical protein